MLKNRSKGSLPAAGRSGTCTRRMRFWYTHAHCSFGEIITMFIDDVYWANRNG